MVLLHDEHAGSFDRGMELMTENGPIIVLGAGGTAAHQKSIR